VDPPLSSLQYTSLIDCQLSPSIDEQVHPQRGRLVCREEKLAVNQTCVLQERRLALAKVIIKSIVRCPPSTDNF
jgi:hypothetical protein